MTSPPDPFRRPDRAVLESWKEIAAYLGRSVRAVQLWEKEEHLPIHRHQHDKQGTVFAYRDELDRWRDARSTPPPPPSPTLVFPEAVSEPEPLPRRKVAGWVLAGAVALVVIATLTAALLWRRDARSGPRAVRSIAVLPLQNADRGSEHLSAGLTELLIDELARLPDLRVKARSSVMHYRGKRVLPDAVGRDLDVDAVLTGEVRREAGRIVARLELVDTRDGAQLWARRYESAAAHLPVIHSRMANDLGLALRARPATRPTSTNALAYEQYLLGLREFHRRSVIPGETKSIHRALEHFQAAVQLDPQFAAAHAGLANAYGPAIMADLITPAEGTVKVLGAAQKALELDPSNAQAYRIIASLKSRILWDFAGAERDFQRAIDLDPSDARARQWYAAHLFMVGRHEDARREVDLAYQLDPLSPSVTSERCWVFYYERRWREAVAFAREVEARDPDRAVPPCMTSSLLALNDYEGFLKYVASRNAPSAANLRAAYARGGARGIYELQRQRLRPSAPVMAARVQATLGDADAAFAFLEAAAASRKPEMSEYHLEPGLDPIRGDPRFAALAQRMGLPSAALDAAARLADRTPFPSLP
jgi:TolB-like protein